MKKCSSVQIMNGKLKIQLNKNLEKKINLGKSNYSRQSTKNQFSQTKRSRKKIQLKSK